MAAEFDPSEFIDDDLRAARQKGAEPAQNPFSAPEAPRAPSREEVEAKVGEMQNKLAELKRTQQELERERAGLEDLRRRQLELTTGRQEMVQHLTRGIGLLEEAEFAARRDAEQMTKSLTEMRAALANVQAIQEQAWTKENLQVELTRALTTVESARMEWNTARLKFAILSDPQAAASTTAEDVKSPSSDLWSERSFFQLCKIGLAFSWPVAVAVLLLVLAIVWR